jgi:hypothetical protein
VPHSPPVGTPPDETLTIVPDDITAEIVYDPIAYLVRLARLVPARYDQRHNPLNARIELAEQLARQRAGATAQAAAARAINTAMANANPHAYRSLALAFAAVVTLATHGRVGPGRRMFTTEDVWAYWREHTDPNVASFLHEPRALGGLFKIASERHMIRATGRYVPGTRPEAHGRPVRLWHPGNKAAEVGQLVPTVLTCLVCGTSLPDASGGVEPLRRMAELVCSAGCADTLTERTSAEPTLDDWLAHMKASHLDDAGMLPTAPDDATSLATWHHQRWSACPGPEVTV